MTRTLVSIPAVAAVVGLVLIGSAGRSAPGETHLGLDRELQALAALPGAPDRFESAGYTRGDVPIRSLEDSASGEGFARRVVLLGGLDGNDRSVDAVIGAARWFKTGAPASLRAQWRLTAIPCGNPEGWAQLKPTNDFGGKPSVNYPPRDGFFNDRMAVEQRYLWRWVTFQAPDLVIEFRGANRPGWLAPPSAASLSAALEARPLVGSDSLPMALGRIPASGLGIVPALVAEARSGDGPALLGAALAAAASLPRSALRLEAERRRARTPRDAALLLAGRYPQQASISYIPALAWTCSLRLSRLTGDPTPAERARQMMRPYLSGDSPTLDGEINGVKLAGHMAFAELALAGDEAAARLTRAAAERFRPDDAAAPARYGQFWCEDLFMTGSLLSRAGRLADGAPLLELAARTHAAYSAVLQQPSGLFHHARDGRFCWGRGNGFAALGLSELLEVLPAGHMHREVLLEAYRRQMAALRAVQAPDGMWRQVADLAGSYREVTATAMTLAAMARGVRLGWLDASYHDAVRRAWSGLSLRIADDGTLTDVCEGTGAGPTLRYYLDRRAIHGMDDRGGAMCLLAAIELMQLPR